MTSNTTHKGHIHSNRESGPGRFDVTFEPRNPEQGEPGIVFELKRIAPHLIQNSTEQVIQQELEQSAIKGLKQIKDKSYDTELRSRGIKNIAYISLAFCGKQMAYKCEEPINLT